jgi:hypothetical protein
MMIRLPREYIRSVHGQLSLMALAFAGAVGLAVVSVCLRSAFFERYARELHPPLEGNLKDLASRLGQGGPASCDRFQEAVQARAEQLLRAAQQRGAGTLEPDEGAGLRPDAALVQAYEPRAREGLIRALYGGWSADAGLDPDNRMLQSLISCERLLIIHSIQRTLAVGNVTQRTRALEAISLLGKGGFNADARALAERARERARRRGEDVLVQFADRVLEQLP